MVRLINAEALESVMYEKSFNTDDGRQRWDSGLWIRYKIFEEAIWEVPAVDAVPVVHGRWIQEFENEDGRDLRCSNCQMKFYVGKGRDGNYCPNCGARMDGDWRKEE